MDMVRESIAQWGPQWRGRRVLVRCDNNVTVSSIQKGRVKVRTLHDLFDRLQETCARYDIDLGVRYNVVLYEYCRHSTEGRKSQEIGNTV